MQKIFNYLSFIGLIALLPIKALAQDSDVTFGSSTLKYCYNPTFGTRLTEFVMYGSWVIVLISLIALVAGLIQPKLFSRILKKRANRGMILIIFLVILVVFLFLIPALYNALIPVLTNNDPSFVIPNCGL